MTRIQKSEVKDMISDVLASQDFLNILVNLLSDKIHELISKECGDIKSHVNRLEVEIKRKDERLISLDNKIENLEQYSRRNNLRVFGLAEDKPEDASRAVINLFKTKMKLEIKPSDIDRVHRIGRVDGDSDKTRPLLIKFTNYNARRSVFTNKKILKGTNIIIREDLTISRLNLLRSALKHYGLRNAWSRDGIIYVKDSKNKISRLEKSAEL